MNALCAVVTVIWVLLWNERTAAFRSGCAGNYCFIISESDKGEGLSQTDAQQWCRDNGSQLAEIVSQDVQHAVETFLRGLSLNITGWIIRTNGLRSSSYSWSRLSGRPMGNITVLDSVYGLFYAYLSSSGIGFDVHASSAVDKGRAGYVCTSNSDSACSDGLRMTDGQCYRSYTQTTRLSWYDARNQCLNKGGDLASFDYITSNDGFHLLNTSWLNTSFSYWIGIRRESWTWQGSNSDLKYSNWQQGQPDLSGRYCLTLFGGDSNFPAFKWWPHTCDESTPFLCVSGLKTTGPTNSASTIISTSQPTGSSDPWKQSSRTETPIDLHELSGSSESNSPSYSTAGVRVSSGLKTDSTVNTTLTETTSEATLKRTCTQSPSTTTQIDSVVNGSTTRMTTERISMQTSTHLPTTSTDLKTTRPTNSASALISPSQTTGSSGPWEQSTQPGGPHALSGSSESNSPSYSTAGPRVSSGLKTDSTVKATLTEKTSEATLKQTTTQSPSTTTQIDSVVNETITRMTAEEMPMQTSTHLPASSRGLKTTRPTNSASTLTSSSQTTGSSDPWKQSTRPETPIDPDALSGSSESNSPSYSTAVPRESSGLETDSTVKATLTEKTSQVMLKQTSTQSTSTTTQIDSVVNGTITRMTTEGISMQTSTHLPTTSTGPETSQSTNSASTLISTSQTTGSSDPGKQSTQPETPIDVTALPDSSESDSPSYSTTDTRVSEELSSDLSSDAKIGIGVGLGVCGFLIIVVVVIAVVLNKKQHARRTWSKKEPSHEMQRQTKDKMTAVESGGRAGEGRAVYAEVVRSSQANKNAVPNLQHQPPPLYQKLEFINNGSHQDHDFRVNSYEMY